MTVYPPAGVAVVAFVAFVVGVAAGVVVSLVLFVSDPVVVGVVVPALPNTPKPKSKPKIKASSAKMPNNGQSHEGHPPFFLGFAYLAGLGSSYFDPRVSILGC